MKDKLFAFNYTRNRDKLLNNLIGIIDGILADSQVNENEVLYLDTWLLEAQTLEQNKCIKLLKLRLQSVLDRDKVIFEELLEIKKLLPKIQTELMDLPALDLYSTEADLHLLTGLCKGLISDKVLSDKEIRYLDWWITQNLSLINEYPGKILYNLIKEILKDGVITQDESEALYGAIVSFTGCDLNSGFVDGLSTRLPVDQIEKIDLLGKNFCLTGEFFTGKRCVVSKLIEQSGGVIQDGVSKKLDYLIVGMGSSRNWKYSSHGRKIEKAMSYRDEDSLPIKIVGEETLIKFLPTTR
ncbi:BRCT domain-containing protein [Yersinia ruckeri]|uniref:BRCT domain-containing protein n=1 Tax=Yersinia ruckeri TaxID=29486 RepID=UPI001F21FFBA|nr:BRCT domain-containing protein [Yersinia ruckeri]UIM99589.1 BRCT domain-containing protein [Yersinia ruckeri]